MKRFLGIIMIVLGILLIIPTLQGFLSTFSMGANSAFEYGLITGNLIGNILFTLLIYFFITRGVKLAKTN